VPFDPVSYALAKKALREAIENLLSELTIDVDKDWGGHNITNLGSGAHDVNARLNLLLAHQARHGIGGADEIADLASHAARHVLGGADEVLNLANINTAVGFSLEAHKARHVAGGADALLDADLDGIVGFDLGAHVSRHASGGADPLTDAILDGVVGFDLGAHASRHATGGADELPANSVTTGMLNFATWEKIAEVVPASDVDYVDFTGLDINTDKFYVLFSTIKNPTASDAWYYAFVEGDYTETNYYSQNVNAAGTTVGGQRLNSPQIAGTGTGENCFFVAWITRDPDGYFRYCSINNKRPASSIIVVCRAGAKTATVTNITSIRISASVSGAIGTGSKFILCKVRTK